MLLFFLHNFIQYVDDGLIPFNWHDANIKPQDPPYYNHASIAEGLSSSFQERYFKGY